MNIDRATAVRQGEELAIDKLKNYLVKQGFNDTIEVQQFPKGYSNLTYLLKIGAASYVLRRPPFGAAIKTAHDMGREYTILSGLIKVYPKVPKPLLYCTDETVIGCPFYIMERVEGIILRPQMPKNELPNAQQMQGIAQSLVSTFAELHAVDYKAAGLAGLGKPDGYVARQVYGWTKRYYKAQTDSIAAIDQVAQWLANNMPKESGAALIHNDYKYDNVVLNPTKPTEIIALLDWEMSTIGDPLMDLGTSLGYWLNAGDPPAIRALELSPTTAPGNPTRAAFAQQYAQKSGKNLDDIVFYYVYGLFKIAVIIQQIYYRYKKGYTQDKRFAGLLGAVKACGLMGSQAIAKKRLDDLF